VLKRVIVLFGPPIDVSLKVLLLQAIDRERAAKRLTEVAEVHFDGLKRVLFHRTVGMNVHVTPNDRFESQGLLGQVELFGDFSVRQEERRNVGVWRRNQPATFHQAKVLLQPRQVAFCLPLVRRLQRSVEFFAADAKDNAKPAIPGRSADGNPGFVILQSW
jgi:hypothetical protein